MKTLLVLLTLCLSLTSFKSHATSIIAAQTAEFYRIDYTSSFGEKFIRGTVTLDFVNNKIKIVLVGENDCPPHAFCVRGPTTERLTATLVSREQMDCGEHVYKAEQNDMAVDGYDLSITVSDMTFLVCKIRPMAPTVVEISKKYFDRKKGEEVVRKGRLFAHPLNGTSPIAE